MNIDGTDLADTLNGTSGNDTLNGLGGDDIIYTGGGVDNIDAGTGDDTIIINGPVGGGSQFKGGDGTDTLQVLASAVTPVTVNGNLVSQVKDRKSVV